MSMPEIERSGAQIEAIFSPCEPQQHRQQLQMRLHNLNPITLAINRI